MKIVNEAGLPYKVIGQVIDDIINSNYEDTIYYGKIEAFTINYKDTNYKVQIRYLKRYTEWWFLCNY